MVAGGCGRLHSAMQHALLLRRAIVALLALLTAAGAFAAGEFEYAPQFAAPTYGAAIMPLDIGLAGNNNSFTMLLPAADVRVSAGSNVTDRDGFWHGYEAGGLFFFQPTAVGFDVPVVGEVGFTDTYNGSDGTPYSASYDVDTSIDIQYVYLLAKYGYRLDIGFKLFGISAGAEVGIGARVVDGHIRRDTSGVGGDDNYGRVE